MDEGTFREGDNLNGCTVQAFIGRGKFAEVYKAECREHGIVGLKYFTDPSIDYDVLLREAFTTTLFNGVPYIVTTYSARMIGNRYPVIIMEYMKGGTLRDRLFEDYLEIEEALEIVSRIALALLAVHGKGYLHRDVCPENVLFDENLRAKLGDLGIAVYHKDEKAKGYAGHVPYMDPELTQEIRFSFKSDLYSLGIIFYELLTGRLPYEVYFEEELRERYESNDLKLSWPDSPIVPNEYKRVIERIYHKGYDGIDEFLADLGGTVTRTIPTQPDPEEQPQPPEIDDLIKGILDKEDSESHFIDVLEEKTFKEYKTLFSENIDKILESFKEDMKITLYFAFNTSIDNKNCYIGLEHLFLALLGRASSLLSGAFSNDDQLIETRSRLEKQLKRMRPLTISGDVFSPRLRKALSPIIQKGQHKVGEKEFLLEALKEDNFSALILQEMGLNLPEFRKELKGCEV
jgi:serine/threonine protein kinase